MLLVPFGLVTLWMALAADIAMSLVTGAGRPRDLIAQAQLDAALVVARSR